MSQLIKKIFYLYSVIHMYRNEIAFLSGILPRNQEWAQVAGWTYPILVQFKHVAVRASHVPCLRILKNSRLLNTLAMLQRAVSRSKALVSSVSPRNQTISSRSLSSPSYSEDIEKLFRYTRGRWLYNEREREYHLPSDVY